MDIESFFTLQVGQNPKNQQGQVPQALGNTVQIHGMSFVDMILSRLSEEVKGDTEQNSEALTETALNEPSKTPEKTEKSTPSVQAYEARDIAATPSDQTTEKSENISILKNENLQEIKSIFESVLLETHADYKPRPGILNKIASKIKQLIEKEDALLTSANLTPAQITDIQTKLENFEESENQEEDLSTIMVGLIKILPQQTQKEIILLPQSLVIASGAKQGGRNAPANDISAQLNALLIEESNTPVARIESPQNGHTPLTQSDTDIKSFEDLVKDFAPSDKKSNNKTSNEATVQDAVKATVKPTASNNLSTLKGWPFSTEGSLMTQGQNTQPLMEGLAQSERFTFNPLAQLTNPITSGQKAAHPHPAMPQIAAKIQKAATNGQNTNITLQMDPPELGRVEVRMEFDKDQKAMKAHIIAEKPETYLMLQRDAHMLERALQDSGVQVDEGMSFELAGDDHNFSHNGGHDGSNSGHSKGENAQTDENIDLIETTMMWHVDPDTGHMRYNILA